MYYPNIKVIFPHIPKTGGSSLEFFIGKLAHPKIYENHKVGNKMRFLNQLYKRYQLEPSDKRWNIHRRTTSYVQKLEDYDDYYSFSFVRNPFSQIKSLYTMNKEDMDKRGKPYPEWEEFIWNQHPKMGIHRLRGFFDQKGFLSHRGQIAVNEVFPFEYYQDAVNLLARKLGFEPDFKVKLWSTKPKYDFNPDMIERVMELYGDSYEFWKKVKSHWEKTGKPYVGRKKSSTGNPG